jgi:hypothetical protein
MFIEPETLALVMTLLERFVFGTHIRGLYLTVSLNLFSRQTAITR